MQPIPSAIGQELTMRLPDYHRSHTNKQPCRLMSKWKQLVDFHVVEQSEIGVSVCSENTSTYAGRKCKNRPEKSTQKDPAVVFDHEKHSS